MTGLKRGVLAVVGEAEQLPRVGPAGSRRCAACGRSRDSGSSWRCCVHRCRESRACRSPNRCASRGRTTPQFRQKRNGAGRERRHRAQLGVDASVRRRSASPGADLLAAARLGRAAASPSARASRLADASICSSGSSGHGSARAREEESGDTVLVVTESVGDLARREADSPRSGSACFQTVVVLLRRTPGRNQRKENSCLVRRGRTAGRSGRDGARRALRATRRPCRPGLMNWCRRKANGLEPVSGCSLQA